MAIYAKGGLIKVYIIIHLTGETTAETVHEDDAVSLTADPEEFQESKPASPPANRKQLERDLHKMQKSAYAAGTVKNLLCQWRAFLRFSHKYHKQEWPVSEHTMYLFAQYLAYSFKSPNSINNYLYGIKTLHVLCQLKPPDLKNIEVKLTMRGLCKILDKQVKRAQPLTPEILLDMLAYINLKKRSDRVFWAILLIGFFGMLQKSNLIPDTVKSFDKCKQLTCGHISFRGDLTIIKVTWAKNLQNRERLVEIPLFPIKESPLCPVTAIRSIWQHKGKLSAPLFGEREKVTFTYNQFQRKFRRVLRRAGYKSKLFSSHSMRRSGASWAHCSGAPESLIQIHGDWGSDCFKRYLNFPVEVRALVSLKIREKIIQSGF